MTAASVSPVPAGGPSGSPSRLRHEYTRGWVAVAISTPFTFAAAVTLELALPGRLSLLPQLLMSWVLWSVAYALLTVRTFGRVSAQQLPSLVSTTKIRTWQRILAGGADGPGFAVQFAALALASAALLPRTKMFAAAHGEDVLLTVLIVATVVTAWVVVTVSYAVHYARVQTAHGGGLAFPGDEPPGFFDYLYFSASVATTLGTTDVEVSATRLRRVVNGHAVLMFVFNTVIVGLMVSALLG